MADHLPQLPHLSSQPSHSSLLSRNWKVGMASFDLVRNCHSFPQTSISPGAPREPLAMIKEKRLDSHSTGHFGDKPAAGPSMPWSGGRGGRGLTEVESEGIFCIEDGFCHEETAEGNDTYSFKKPAGGQQPHRQENWKNFNNRHIRTWTPSIK